ncbi:MULTISPECIES: hypothetical protein [unclassified Neisseria]|uniref:hypothetical protein n=1 Tax=unclassified Neisseria TaxID=2623750 RepID=UPI0026665803|nr:MULTISPECIES: hypothetical protein [unclassified Neisseria]MDO1510906.1 hypothetical protein [Neisseria sp. MVDL19-042950]MDO1517196.1 hypothetical protein [Neisseria sp. MVDL18-041461]MDO1564535.1 hypothetical protein [Neisseria sp. MVDL20-010259]
MRKNAGITNVEGVFVLCLVIITLAAGFGAFNAARAMAFDVPTVYAEPLLVEMMPQVVGKADNFQTTTLIVDDLMERKTAELEVSKMYEQESFDFMQEVVCR